MYDHLNDTIGDFDVLDAVNLADEPEQAAVVAALSGSMRYFFRVAQCTKTLCSPAEQAAARAAQGIASGALQHPREDATTHNSAANT